MPFGQFRVRWAPQPGASSACLSVLSRRTSQPVVELALVLSDHSLGTWCGACVAPEAKYMKNGLSGVSAFCWRTQVMARFARSPVSV